MSRVARTRWAVWTTALLAAVLVAGVACRRDDPALRGGPEGPASPAPSPDRPAELPGASCEEQTGGSGRNIPDFVAVEVESRGGVDRVTFRFEPRKPGAKQPPWHVVRFADALHTDPVGEPADVEGDAFVLVVFGAFGVDISGEEPRQIYTGPTELRPELSTVREVEQLGDFEATVSWGIGLSHRACVVVDAAPDHLTLAFPNG